MYKVELIPYILIIHLLDYNYINIHIDNIDIGIGKFKLRNGKLVMFAHGHQDKTTTVVQDFIGATREFVDYIILAHYHSSAEKTFQGTKVFISGSIIGTDAWKDYFYEW